MTITATEASPNSTWRLEADEVGDGSTWTPVAGLNSFAANQNYSTADNSDFNSGLYGSDAVTQIKEQIAATVLRRNDGTAYDAGQEAIRAAARTAELLKIRYYDTAFTSAESYEADVYCQWSPQGGAGTGLQSVNITLLVQGEPAEIANPVAGITVWSANTYYARGAQVTVSGGTLESTEEGTSGATEPTAPTAVGGTVVDGTITWERTA